MGSSTWRSRRGRCPRLRGRWRTAGAGAGPPGAPPPWGSPARAGPSPTAPPTGPSRCARRESEPPPGAMPARPGPGPAGGWEPRAPGHGPRPWPPEKGRPAPNAPNPAGAQPGPAHHADRPARHAGPRPRDTAAARAGLGGVPRRQSRGPAWAPPACGPARPPRARSGWPERGGGRCRCRCWKEEEAKEAEPPATDSLSPSLSPRQRPQRPPPGAEERPGVAG